MDIAGWFFIGLLLMIAVLIYVQLQTGKCYRCGTWVWWGAIDCSPTNGYPKTTICHKCSHKPKPAPQIPSSN